MRKTDLDNGDQWNWWFICDFILRSTIHLRHSEADTAAKKSEIEAVEETT